MSRTKIPIEDRRLHYVNIPFTLTEKNFVVETARKLKALPSRWARQLLLNEATRVDKIENKKMIRCLHCGGLGVVKTTGQPFASANTDPEETE